VIVLVAQGAWDNFGEVYRDDARLARAVKEVTPYFHQDFEWVIPLPGGATRGTGWEAFSSALRDWFAPWASYRREVIEAIDCGDRVLLLADQWGRLEGSTQEVKEAAASVWTVREGQVARLLYAHRSEALQAAGL
jgi:ketosteroid isomerase-like protein